MVGYRRNHQGENISCLALPQTASIQNYIEIYHHVGHHVTTGQIGKIVKSVIEGAGGSSSWFESLQNLRNYFIHEGAPYFAIDLTSPDTFELLVMRENLKSFDDESKFVRLKPEFESILEGFFKGNKILQTHVIDLLSS